MWVFDKRFLFNIEHTRDRILVAWCVPIMLTVAVICSILAERQGEPQWMWIAISLGLAKIICMGVLCLRQL